MKRIRLSIFAIVACLIFSSAAQAAEVDFTNVGTQLNMGHVVAGQYGSIDYRRPGAAYHRTSGLLAAGTKMTFNYNFTGPLADFASEVTSASYGYMHEGDEYTGFAISNRFTDPLSALNSDSAMGFKNLAPDVPLLFATANFSKGSNTATISIINESLGVASFVSALTLLFASNPSIDSLTYSVSSLAAPLPAALPMFFALMGGMFGFRRLRRRSIVR